MTDQLERLKAALSASYAFERELGAGGWATVYLAEGFRALKRRLGTTAGAVVHVLKDAIRCPSGHVPQGPSPAFKPGDAIGRSRTAQNDLGSSAFSFVPVRLRPSSIVSS